MHTPLPATRTLGSWLLCLFALVLSSSAWAQRGDAGLYRIEQALYGTAQHNIDATQRLQQLARRDQRFLLSNDLFQADPAPGQRKMLRIYARGQDGQLRTFDYPEGSWVDGAQFIGWRGGEWGAGRGPAGRPDGGQGGWHGGGGQVQQATYGTEESRVDVSEPVRQWVQRDQRFQVHPSLFRGDPAPGQLKTLRIHATGPGGQVHVYEYPDGSWVDGAQFSAGRDRPGNAGGYGRLNIHRALYGDGYRQVDITERLRSFQREGRLEVAVGNDLAGVDPAPHVRKSLRVEFSLGNGPVQQVVVPESQLLRLP
ncbi:hypothetical protein B2J86_12560 [Acidovorax sp. SRB_14]|uniref:hypothetical protein n=1 Tax=unclassified Acidovorax TaxID=2684926 RepID=UPI00145F6487|nr:MULTISPECIES: hypothetical protein [unclassified Acidovorax]NMM76138.1 hypothetical protein [Acidovorax sp. SRB_24]NMM81743.1 hypothetical protein [Acidovorax sp. SRB_14]NMM86482.1 hypothetical protein [Rhodococcus sp. SRB_17]